MELTNENYFSTEMNMKYMGASQLKAFEKCEAAALAEIKGEYVRPASKSMLVGSYVDAHFSNEMDIFKAKNPDIFKRDGSLKSEFVHANDIIARIEADEMMSLLMSGKHQVIKTGEIAGIPFKIKIDSLLDSGTCKTIAEKFPETAMQLTFADGMIVDQKIMRDLLPIWSPSEHARVSFVKYWGYDTQGAIYQAIEGNSLPFVLAVATSEDAANIAAISIPDEDLQAKLYEIEDEVPRFQAIKKGLLAPKRCENCPYCNATRRLSRIIDYRELAENA